MCEAVERGPAAEEELLVLEWGERAFVIMNSYPYSNGHLLIAPRDHVGDYEQLDDATLTEIGQLTRTWVGVLRQAMRPDGFNLGWNLGKAAGAGVADHLHQHIVPRWTGDVNFMAACADLRVINQSLAEAWQLLRRVRLGGPATDGAPAAGEPATLQ
jgi:ATP adenylyltransferase